MLLGKTFIAAAALGRGRGRGQPLATCNATRRLRRPGTTGIHKSRHGLVGRSEDFYAAEAKPDRVDV